MPKYFTWFSSATKRPLSLYVSTGIPESGFNLENLGDEYIQISNYVHGATTYSRYAYIKMVESTLCWYAEQVLAEGSSIKPSDMSQYQLNESGTEYHWLAIG